MDNICFFYACIYYNSQAREKQEREPAAFLIFHAEIKQRGCQRMVIVSVNESKCKGCALCVSACPKKIMKISDRANQSGQYVAVCSDPPSCIGCKCCGIICPDDAITIEKED